MSRTSANILGGLPRPRWQTIGTISLLAATAIAAALEPPIAYLVPLAAAAWTLAIATIRNERRPRYRRH
jgi:hypothetical protein